MSSKLQLSIYLWVHALKPLPLGAQLGAQLGVSHEALFRTELFQACLYNKMTEFA